MVTGKRPNKKRRRPVLLGKRKAYETIAWPVKPIGRTNGHRCEEREGVDLIHATAKPNRRSGWRLARQGTCPRFASLGCRGGGRSGCFSIRHSSRLWLPARLDSHGLSWRPVSRAGHAPG